MNLEKKVLAIGFGAGLALSGFMMSDVGGDCLYKIYQVASSIEGKYPGIFSSFAGSTVGVMLASSKPAVRYTNRIKKGMMNAALYGPIR
ncbi:MAG: hypothetical protein WCK90_01145 [archaeon]